MSERDNADRPATFREVLASGEFRALYAAAALSWFGDYVARAAVTALVYHRTGSVAASAATFAISYLPWLGLGTVLSALAERLPYRSTMINADLARMVLIALVAIPGLPVWAMILLLFATAVCNPPFDAARSALLPKVLDGDRYIVGVTIQNTSFQTAQIVGYVSGAGLATTAPNGALLFNAVTFGISACLIGLGVHERPAALAVEDRTDLFHETVSGIRMVFGTPVLRAVAVVIFASMLFAAVPEGLAAAWAADLSSDRAYQGWIQGCIMISNPVGFVVGGLIVGRFMKPSTRQRLVPVFAMVVPTCLAFAIFDPSPPVVYVLSFISGTAAAGLLPATNALFVQALPDPFRARAFGVMKSGIQVFQGVAVFATGALSERWSLPLVVGIWGFAGIALLAVAVLTWPDKTEIATEITRVKALNAAATSAREATAGGGVTLPNQTGTAQAKPA